MGIIYLLVHPTNFTNRHHCDQVIYPVKILLLKTIVVGVFKGLQHTVCEWKMHWELSEAATLVIINYNFSDGQNDPATFHTAHLEDMHQSLTRISYSLWRSRRGGEE